MGILRPLFRLRRRKICTVLGGTQTPSNKRCPHSATTSLVWKSFSKKKLRHAGSVFFLGEEIQLWQIKWNYYCILCSWKYQQSYHHHTAQYSSTTQQHRKKKKHQRPTVRPNLSNFNFPESHSHCVRYATGTTTPCVVEENQWSDIPSGWPLRSFPRSGRGALALTPNGGVWD